MPTLDSQVHAYERDHPGRPWAGVLHGPAEVTGDQMVAAMAAVGVDGAVLVSPFSMYRYDASYAIAVHAANPEPVKVGEASRYDRSRGSRYDRRLHRWHGRHPDHARRGFGQPRRSWHQPGPGRRGATFLAGQPSG